MFVILVLSFILVYLSISDENVRYIETWIKAAVVWCGMLYFKTEILSVFGKMNKMTVFCFLDGCVYGGVVPDHRKKEVAICRNDIVGYCKYS